MFKNFLSDYINITHKENVNDDALSFTFAITFMNGENKFDEVIKAATHDEAQKQAIQYTKKSRDYIEIQDIRRLEIKSCIKDKYVLNVKSFEVPKNINKNQLKTNIKNKLNEQLDNSFNNMEKSNYTEEITINGIEEVLFMLKEYESRFGKNI